MSNITYEIVIDNGHTEETYIYPTLQKASDAWAVFTLARKNYFSMTMSWYDDDGHGGVHQHWEFE